VSGGDPKAASRHLADAAAIWNEVGNPLGEAKVELVQAALDRAPGAALRRRRAERQLEVFGVRAHAGGNVAAGPVAAVANAEQPAVRITALGGFAVARSGEVVRVSEWQSKRARDLLKVLVARRGRPAPRAMLIELLWPGDEEAERLSNRLSVALTTIRGVLDPARRYPSEHFITAAGDAVALNLDTTEIDLEAFLAAAGDGLSRLRAGDIARSIPALEAASVAYAGDFLEENQYDDWAVPPREEARAAFIAVSRALASEASANHEPDRAVAHYLRVLEVDRFDESAHLALVAVLTAAGRHGEAHRHFLSYRRAMEELGVEPVAFPAHREVAAAAFTQP
jgi:DNA-binding SARP family transcriptional activator